MNCSIDTFEAAGEDLLPTPAKSHYTFNLRDIWKVFQGICSLKSKKVSDPLAPRANPHLYNKQYHAISCNILKDMQIEVENAKKEIVMNSYEFCIS